MRKYLNYITISLLVLVAASSCKKWLDVTPGNQVRAEDQFSSEAGFRDALMGVYLTMTEQATYSRNNTWGAMDFIAQPYRKMSSGSDFIEMQTYQYKSLKGMAIVEDMWRGNYNSIANINSMLEHLDKKKNEVNAISYSIMKGELLGLRAFLHFDLMRIFGRSNFAGRPELASKPTIPYVTVFTKEVTPQQSYTRTFELMEKDIADALQLLKEDPVFKNPGRPANYYAEVNRSGFYNNRNFRMNYYAVKALQARILLWQGSNTKIAAAAQAAGEVINGSFATLISSGNAVKDVILKSEHLFTLNVDRFYDIINMNLLNTVSDDGVMMYQADFFSIYENNSGVGLSDFRQLNWFNDMGTTDKSYVLKKFLQNESDLTNRNRLPLIRLSEMYYIAAEANITTNLPQAIQLLNTVRRSRGIISDIPADATATVVADELTKEYRKDFVQEGQLFFYYKRKGFTAFYGLPVSTTGNDAIYMLPYPNSETESGGREQ